MLSSDTQSVETRRESDWTMTRLIVDSRGMKVTVAEPRGVKVTVTARAGKNDKDNVFPELIKKFMTHAAAGSFFSGYYNTSILPLVMIMLFAHTAPRH